MAARKAKKKGSTLFGPQLHKAVRGSLGKVSRGEELTETDAIVEYAAGNDVVVCGEDTASNRSIAQRIANAVGPYRREVPHTVHAGPYALPHFQPQTRTPDGHVFYETERRKAAVNV